jgi:hypothetical protein
METVPTQTDEVHSEPLEKNEPPSGPTLGHHAPLDRVEAIPKGQGDVDVYASTFHPGARFYVAIVSLLVIMLMAALDATSLSVAIPNITRALNGTAIEGFWSGTSFLLTSTVSC